MNVRILRALRRCAAVLACAAFPAAASAQAGAADPPRGFCWMGRPAESCRLFLVAELSGHLVLGGTRYTVLHYDGRTSRRLHLRPHVAWEVGVVGNVTPQTAAGATVMLGYDRGGVRGALKARYRRWQGRRRALDAGMGVLAAHRGVPVPPEEGFGNLEAPGVGLTGDLAVGLTDWGSPSVRADLLFGGDGAPAASVYGGVNLSWARFPALPSRCSAWGRWRPSRRRSAAPAEPRAGCRHRSPGPVFQLRVPGRPIPPSVHRSRMRSGGAQVVAIRHRALSSRAPRRAGLSARAAVPAASGPAPRRARPRSPAASPPQRPPGSHRIQVAAAVALHHQVSSRSAGQQTSQSARRGPPAGGRRHLQ